VNSLGSNRTTRVRRGRLNPEKDCKKETRKGEGTLTTQLRHKRETIKTALVLEKKAKGTGFATREREISFGAGEEGGEKAGKIG